MTARSCLAFASLVAVLIGCASNVMTFTQSLREGEMTREQLQQATYRTAGEFELRSPLAKVTVEPRTPAVYVDAPDDTTLVVDATVPSTDLRRLVETSGKPASLRLTFARARDQNGTYTLRAVNGQPIDARIQVGENPMEYVPCYENVGWKCLNPLQPGTREDRMLTLEVKRGS